MHIIVTVIGPDRKGIVHELSSVVREASGNWEGSRMIRLAGHFSGMVQVVIAESDLPKLEKSLQQLAGLGLAASIIRSDVTPPLPHGSDQTILLEVVGSDRPGIVSEISNTLSEHGASFVELATDCTDAPMSGERLFRTHARIEIASEVDPDFLKEQVEAISDDLMVEMEGA